MIDGIDESTPLYGSFVSLDFSRVPYWGELRNEATLTSTRESTAIIDNTMVRNALTLMREGLGDESTLNAVLLPDLAALFFAITHFDRLLLLAHSLTPAELSEVEQQFSGIVRPVDWASILHLNPDLYDNTAHMLTTIQEQFKARDDLHPAWSKAWAALFGVDDPTIIQLEFFLEGTGLIDRVINTPVSPLSPSLHEMEGSMQGIVRELQQPETLYNKSIGLMRATGFLGHLFEIDTPKLISFVASYYTYRSIFYHCLADYLKFPYIPCGMRGVAMNLLPVRHLHDNMSPLNPVEIAGMQQTKTAGMQQTKTSVKLLRITPNLAALFEAIRQRGLRPNADQSRIDWWSAVVQDLREESDSYRLHCASLFKFEEGRIDAVALRDAIAYINDPSARKPSLSISSIMRGGSDIFSSSIMLLVGPHVPGAIIVAVLKGASGVAALAAPPLQRALSEADLRFVLRAHDLAQEALDLEDGCAEIWGRRFSSGERRYLRSLASLEPIEDVQYWV